MISNKQAAIELLQAMPEAATWDDIAEEIEIHAALERSRIEADAGLLIDNEEVMRKFDKWLKPIK